MGRAAPPIPVAVGASSCIVRPLEIGGIERCAL
jgi:hypothetical protein